MVGQIIVCASLPLIALDLFHVIAPFSIDFLLNALGIGPRWSMGITVITYPVAIATLIELIFPKRKRNIDKPEP